MFVGVAVAVGVEVPVGVLDGVVRLKANSLQLSASAHIVGASPQAVSPLNIFGSAFAHMNHAPSDGSVGPDTPLYCSAFVLHAPLSWVGSPSRHSIQPDVASEVSGAVGATASSLN